MEKPARTPAPVLTLLAVLALAALLTTVRHNASAYRTGVWDTGSQTLVYGRMHQMEQGQHAPGGFLGVYTDDWSDDRTAHCSGTTPPPTRQRSTPHPPVGLAGLAVRRGQPSAAALLPEGIARETALYWLNSTLFYAAELLMALAVWEEWACGRPRSGLHPYYWPHGCSAA